MEKALEVHPDERPYAWAEVDLGAIRDNASLLASKAQPAALCAVVKGWAYGHGVTRAANAAVEGGASWLGVALVNEAADVRRQLSEPVLILAEPPVAQLCDVAHLEGVRPTLYRAEAVRAAAKAVRDVGRSSPLPVHLKVDTGMHRVGATPDDAIELARLIDASEELALEGLWTHLAAAEDPAHDDYTAHQLAAFEDVRARVAALGIEPQLVHAANSGGLLAHPEARYDMVRCGIALYGIPPRPRMPEAEDLHPAMSLKARVSFVKRVDAGEPISYGLHYTCERQSIIATVPLGYYDGVSRRLGLVGGDVLIGGRRRPVVGAVTMDQLMVDCGDDESIQVGDEVVLFGRQDGGVITAWDWAERLDTIAYEVICAVSINRVPRRYLG
jgi:alanine racemase